MYQHMYLMYYFVFGVFGYSITLVKKSHRIGQQARVRCLYFIAKGTLDEVLWRLIENEGFVGSATLYDALLILMFNARKPQLQFYFTDFIRQMHG